jgi:hypothetical protein
MNPISEFGITQVPNAAAVLELGAWMVGALAGTARGISEGGQMSVGGQTCH